MNDRILNMKNILLGISGGIAAYKAPLLVRLLQKEGADVQVVMTENAGRFVTPMTLSTLSGNPVYDSLWTQPDRVDVRHVSLADWADIMVIAPATANVIGKLASGIADDLLTTVLLSVRCPVLLCPAMATPMYENPMVAENIDKLARYGYHIMSPGIGELACGKSGPGRMRNPEEILKEIKQLLSK